MKKNENVQMKAHLQLQVKRFCWSANFFKQDFRYDASYLFGLITKTAKIQIRNY